MGDDFFKTFFIGIFVAIFVFGAFIFFQMEKETENKREVKEYLESHGKTAIPKSWREQVGDGI